MKSNGEAVFLVPMTLVGLEDLLCVVTNYHAHRRSEGETRDDLYPIQAQLQTAIHCIQTGTMKPHDYPAQQRA